MAPAPAPGTGVEACWFPVGGIDSEADDIAAGGSSCAALGRRGLGLPAVLDEGLDPGDGVEGADAGRGPNGESGGLSDAQWSGRREVELVTTSACNSETRNEQSSSM